MTDTPQSVTTDRDGEILSIIINNPPVNALSWHVRQGISDAMDAAMAEDRVRHRAILDALPDLVWLKDPAGYIKAADAKFPSLLKK